MMTNDPAQRALTDLANAREAFREAVRGGNADEISFAGAMLEAAQRACGTKFKVVTMYEGKGDVDLTPPNPLKPKTTVGSPTNARCPHVKKPDEEV